MKKATITSFILATIMTLSLASTSLLATSETQEDATAFQSLADSQIKAEQEKTAKLKAEIERLTLEKLENLEKKAKAEEEPSLQNNLPEQTSWITPMNVAIGCGVVIAGVCGAWYLGLGPFAVALVELTPAITVNFMNQAHQASGHGATELYLLKENSPDVYASIWAAYISLLRQHGYHR